MRGSEEFHLRNYLRILSKRKWAVITFFTILVVTVIIVTYSMRPVYRTTAQILIERDDPHVVSIQDVLAIDATTTDYYQSQYEILKSDTLSMRVIRRLDLDKQVGSFPGFSRQQSSEKAFLVTFQKNLIIDPLRNSRIVRIGFTSYDPTQAVKVVNTLTEEYISYSMEMKINASQEAVKWLTSRVDEMREKVRESEEAFENHRESLSAKIAKEMRSSSVLSEHESRPEVVKNEHIQNLKTEEIKLFATLAQLTHKYGPRHPQIIQVTSQLAALRERIREEISKVVGALKIEESPKYLLLKREAEANRELYEILLKRLKETALTETLPRSNIHVIDSARLPHKPVSPRKGLHVLLAVILGLMLGSGSAFFLEYLDNTVKNQEDIEQHLQLPLLGVVPSAMTKEKKVIETITAVSPKSILSEAYRTIRTGVFLSSVDESTKTLLVTSAGPLEGKTTTAVNLAIAMAQAERKVLLVDADLRRPRLHKIFDLDNSEGLTTSLLDRQGGRPLPRETGIPFLYVLTSGPVPPNPAELLGSMKMRETLIELREQFDKIILDSPPLIPVADAIILAALSDEVILVVRGSYTVKRVVQEGKRRLEESKGKILGVVLNGISREEDGYYPSYYYDYAGTGEA